MNKSGFTLIELMIVVVIIGILASIAIPRFMEAAKKAKVSEAVNVLKQLYSLNQTFYQESGHFAPAAQLTMPMYAPDGLFNPDWFDVAAAEIADSLCFDLPSGMPRFDYYINGDGSAYAIANAQDGTLAGIRVDIDAIGSLTSTFP